MTAALSLMFLLLSCKDKGSADSGGPGDGGADTADSGGPPGCTGTADGTLPAGLTELAWDDGSGVASLVGQGWSIADTSLEDAVVNEWVRFEPEDTVLVRAIQVQLQSLPADPEALVTMALYPDFGHNGFDAWAEGPLWTGTRCAGDLVEGEWATFVLDTPVEVPAGSLIYAGHERQGAGDVAIPFDAASQGDGTCATWDDCHSAMNLPELTSFVSGGYSYSFWKGYSFSLQYDYLVRLQVEVTDHVDEADKVFHEVSEIPAGSRQSWGDYDHDGLDDLYLPGQLLHNEGGGVFADVTAESGISSMGLSSSGGVWGDYDNDGCLDLFVFSESYTTGDALLHSECDGTFTDQTLAAGITDLQTYNDCGDPSRTDTPTAAAAWWDMNGDGLLDLYLADFICWDDYTYYVDQVFTNDGDGSFTDISGTQGLSTTALAGRAASPVDADLDGDVDMLVGNYVLQRNLFYENQGDGTVLERGTSVGLAGKATREGTVNYYAHTIGTAWGDLANDGSWDAVEANLAHPRYFDFSDKSGVFMGNGDGTWTNNAGDWTDPFPDNGMRYQETYSVPTLGDFDSDGVLDMAITAVYDGRPTDLYWGVGDGTFTPGFAESGITTENGWGMSAGDYDNDGDLDLATSGGFFENRGAQGHWLQVHPLGVTSNRAAIGAIVQVQTSDGTVRMRQVQGGTGQGEQDSATLQFGLGASDTVTRITVRFIGGATQEWTGSWKADQRLWASEDGSLESGWAPPAG